MYKLIFVSILMARTKQSKVEKKPVTTTKSTIFHFNTFRRKKGQENQKG